MISEIQWFEKPLGEVTFNHDGKRKPVKESERKKGSYPYYGASGIVDYVDGYLFDGHYLLIAEDGENLRTRQTPIAFMADGKFWVNNHAHVVTGNGEVRTEYLHYFLQYADIQSYLTGAVMPKLTQGNLNRIPVRYPEPDYQKQIIQILGAFDRKIELNRNINQILEAMAQATFKSWFIDFDPVKAKIAAIEQGKDPLRAAMRSLSGKKDAELDEIPLEHYNQLSTTAALFPDEMHESESGGIPKNWVFQASELLAEVGIGKTPPRKEPQWFTEGEGDLRWVSIKDMGASGVFQQAASEFLTSEAVSRFNVRVVPDRTVLLSFKLTIGRVAITDGPMVTNEAIAHFKLPLDSVISSEYLYLYLKCFDYSTLGSTSSIADAVNSKTIRQMPIIVANDELIDCFTKSVSHMFEEMRNRQNEIAALVETRDSLLPMLLSGEVEVPA